jgi:sulfur carrier protein
MRKIIVNGNEIDWEENMTINVVLKRMNYTFRMLVIKIDGTLVKRADYDTTTVPDGADVEVIHLISGG